MRRVLVLWCLCLLVAPRAARAEWHFTPMIGLTFSGDTSIRDPDLASDNVHTNLGGAVTLLGNGIFGVEGLVVFTPRFFQGGPNLVKSSRSVVLMGNLMVTVPRRWTEYFLRPFVSAGIGLLHASYTERFELVGPVNDNILGFNVGGGAIGFLSADTGVRFDLRYYSNLHRVGGQDLTLRGDPVHLRYMTASIGLVFRR